MRGIEKEREVKILVTQFGVDVVSAAESLFTKCCYGVEKNRELAELAELAELLSNFSYLFCRSTNFVSITIIM